MKLKASFSVEITDEVETVNVEIIHTDEEIKLAITEMLLEMCSSKGTVSIDNLKITHEA